MRKIKKVVSMFIVMCLVLGISIGAFADGSDVNEARNGVLQVNLTYVGDNGQSVVLQSGTGFLINNDTLITNEHVIVLQDDTREEMKNISGLQDIADITINDPHMHIYVVVQRDMTVEAKCHSSAHSGEVDFAVLQFVNPVYDRTPLKLADSDEIKASEKIYALGMPASSINTTESHTSDDVTVTDGIASKLTELNGIKVIEHNVKISEGSSGGPMVNEDGAVVAVNSYRTEEFYYSIQINHIKNALDTFGIAYTEYSGSEPLTEESATQSENMTLPTPESTPELTGDTTELVAELRTAISNANIKIADRSAYTEDSVKSVESIISNAETILNKSDVTSAELQNSIDELQRLDSILIEKTGPDMMVIGIIIAAIVLVLVIVVVIIILAVSGKSKKKTGPATTPSIGMGMTPPVSPVTPMPAYPPVDAGSSETTVLNQGAGETTVLGGGVASAYLIRKKTGEKISLNTPSFMIGKEKRRVNYCISDNSSISRAHAQITRKGSDYYIVDQNSTNFTFVNGTKSNPNQETLLTNGAIVKLADEEFEFHS